jgi:hypothetical protein
MEGILMARIITTVCIVGAVLVMGSLNFVAPRDGLVMFGGKAFAADMATKAPVMAPAPVGKGKSPIGKGKGKAPVVTRG